MKKLNLLGLTVVTAVVTVVAPVMTKADTINIGGVIGINPDSSMSSCAAGSTACQDITFSGVTVVAPTDPSDPSLIGAGVTLPNFGLGWNGTMATFDPAMGPIGITNGANSLSGTVAWEKLTGTGVGGFQFSVGLSGLASTGTDVILNDFAKSGVGSGVLTFQFTTAPQTITDLFANQAQLSTSLSGTLSTPEPASMALLGGGLIGLSLLSRKRRKS